MDAVERDVRVYEALLRAVETQVDRGRADLQFFLVLNASIAAAALATIELLDRREAAFVSFLAFAGGFGLALAGLRVSKNNKRYYRAFVVKRVLMEERLGLLAPLPGREQSAYANFSLGALATADKISEILADPDGYVTPRARRGSSTEWWQWALFGFAIFHLAAALVFANRLMGCVAAIIPCTGA